MLKKDVKQYDKNIFKELEESWAICTAGDRNSGFNCLTVSWGGIGMLWGKPVGFVFVRNSRYTHSFLEKSEGITLSFLSDAYQEAKQYLGQVSGRNEDKLAKSGLSYTYDPDMDVCYIRQASYVFKMKKLLSVDLDSDLLKEDLKEKFYSVKDDHTLYICEIKQYLTKEKEA